MDVNKPVEAVPTCMRGYTSSQPLPTLVDMPHFPIGAATGPLSQRSPSHVPHPWTPRFIPENWVYMDGSDIKGQPRLGAVVVHILTRTTIYIDAAGTEETRTITRAELVAIHTALTIFASHEWIGIFTNSLSNLQATRRHNTNPSIRRFHHYRHDMLLLRKYHGPHRAQEVA